MDFHTFWTPDQIILNDCCPQLRVSEQSEIIGKFKIYKITQGFSYFLQIPLNGLCLHLRILDHGEITDLFENLHISLDQCKKMISQKVCSMPMLSPHVLAIKLFRQISCSRCSPAHGRPERIPVVPDDFSGCPRRFSGRPKRLSGRPKRLSGRLTFLLPINVLNVPDDFPVVPDDFSVVPDDFPVIPDAALPDYFPVIPDDFLVVPGFLDMRYSGLGRRSFNT